MSKKTLKHAWLITREYEGLAGAGGIKDVCRQLAEALSRHCQVSVCLPCYGFMNPKDLGFSPGPQFTVDMDYVGEERREEIQVWQQEWANLHIYLIDTRRYREKNSVYTYSTADEEANPLHQQGNGHYDYFAMNVLLEKAALCLMMILREPPAIIHCHDGHTALIPAMARELEGFRHFFRNTGMVVTVHNAGLGYHQEIDDLPFARAITGLPTAVTDQHLLHGSFNPFLAAGPYAIINTVSENYARELQETQADKLTGGLGHLLREKGVQIRGITNGINPGDFNPRHHKILNLAAPFNPATMDLAGKKICKKSLINHLDQLTGVTVHGSLAMEPDWPLLSMISRFSAQKGFADLIKTLTRLLAEDKKFQVVILGTGSREIEAELTSLCQKFKGRLCVLQGYDRDIANKIYAAGDFFLLPSLYEPCGLTDYIAQLFGNIPIVHHVGGLVKIIHGQTGFSYGAHNNTTLEETIKNALKIFRRNPEILAKIQRKAVLNIRENYSWNQVVRKYLQLYREAITLCRK